MKCWGRPQLKPFKFILLGAAIIFIGLPGGFLSFITIGMFKASCVLDFLDNVCDRLNL